MKVEETSDIYRGEKSLTMSWSETGPMLVTKMSVLTSVTRSVEAGNCQSE